VHEDFAMAQPPTFDLPGGIYFVTSRVENDRIKLDTSDLTIIHAVLLGLTSCGEKWIPCLPGESFMGSDDGRETPHIILYSHVIMPNHFHALLKPVYGSISVIMQLIKGRSSKLLGRGKLWQKGFYDFSIIKEATFKQKVNYIHENPVRWGLVERPEDYAFSSAGAYKKKYGGVYYL
jgi:hypothetical protein